MYQGNEDTMRKKWQLAIFYFLPPIWRAVHRAERKKKNPKKDNIIPPQFSSFYFLFLTMRTKQVSKKSQKASNVPERQSVRVACVKSAAAVAKSTRPAPKNRKSPPSSTTTKKQPKKANTSSKTTTKSSTKTTPKTNASNKEVTLLKKLWTSSLQLRQNGGCKINHLRKSRWF